MKTFTYSKKEPPTWLRVLLIVSSLGLMLTGLFYACTPEPANAGSLKTYGHAVAEVVRIIDGDTVVVNIENVPLVVGHEISVRVYGIDTRELGDGGEKSTAFVEKIIQPGDTVFLIDIRRGKFFRLVATVLTIRGENIAEVLLENDLAYPYYGGKKRPDGWKPKDYKP